MLNRIKWSEEIAGEKKIRKRDQEQMEGERNECILVSLLNKIISIRRNLYDKK